MCLIAFAIGMHARWPLVIASNRDEVHTRPTAPLACWQGPQGQRIASGRDLRDGGTWLGVSAHGRVAMLTNVRSGQAQVGRRSRGELVTRWLDGKEHFPDFCRALGLPHAAVRYGGFNLVTGDWYSGQWHWLTNMADMRWGEVRSQVLGAGLYGLSNAALDTPWPKTLALKSALQQALGQAVETDSFENLRIRLWPALLDTRLASSESLPDTGIGPQREHALSGAFVDLPGYGTRCTTVIAVGYGPTQRLTHTVCIYEQTHGLHHGDTSESFNW